MMIQEIYVFLSAMGTGLIAGFLYDLFRLKRKALKTRELILTLEDVVFWMITAVLVFVSAYISNQGEIRLYFFLAMLAGAAFYFSVLSHWVIQIVTFVVQMLIMPFAFLIRILKPPTKWILGLITKEVKQTQKSIRNTKRKASLRFKSVGKIIRKV